MSLESLRQVHEVLQAIARWETLLLPFWEQVHIEHPELESEAFKAALREYTYGIDIAGAFMEGGDSANALGHLADALAAIYKMLEAEGIAGSGIGLAGPSHSRANEQ